jgi:AcrR family transcriptional regulator
MPRASAADAALTAQKVLDAALKCFTRHGYHATSVDQIAKSAGVTRGAVYHHFHDKTGLLRAIVRAGHERVAAYVVARAEPHEDDPVALLRSGCHAFVDGVTHDEAARLILIDGPAALGWTEWRALDEAASMNELREALALLVPTAEVEALTRLLSGAMNEGVLWLIHRPDDQEARDAIHRALDQLVDAVGASATGHRAAS